MAESIQLGEFLDRVKTRLKRVMSDEESKRVMISLLPHILKFGHDDGQLPDEDTDYEVLAWAIFVLLECIADLKGLEPIFQEPDHK